MRNIDGVDLATLLDGSCHLGPTTITIRPLIDKLLPKTYTENGKA